MSQIKLEQEKIGGIHAIPTLAPQWKKLDLAEILKRKAAFVSVSQNKSLYGIHGVLKAKRITGKEGVYQRPLRLCKLQEEQIILFLLVGSDTACFEKITHKQFLIRFNTRLGLKTSTFQKKKRKKIMNWLMSYRNL